MLAVSKMVCNILSWGNFLDSGPSTESQDNLLLTANPNSENIQSCPLNNNINMDKISTIPHITTGKYNVKYSTCHKINTGGTRDQREIHSCKIKNSQTKENCNDEISFPREIHYKCSQGARSACNINHTNIKICSACRDELCMRNIVKQARAIIKYTADGIAIEGYRTRLQHMLQQNGDILYRYNLVDSLTRFEKIILLREVMKVTNNWELAEDTSAWMGWLDLYHMQLNIMEALEYVYLEKTTLQPYTSLDFILMPFFKKAPFEFICACFERMDAEVFINSFGTLSEKLGHIVRVVCASAYDTQSKHKYILMFIGFCKNKYTYRFHNMNIEQLNYLLVEKVPNADSFIPILNVTFNLELRINMPIRDSNSEICEFGNEIDQAKPLEYLNSLVETAMERLSINK